jgi:release factor glutamine methyltransferase
VGEFLRAATARLAASSPSARLDAEALVMQVCGLTRAELLTRSDAELCETVHPQLEALLARRARGEPIAYLTGRREFWSLALRVTPQVLVPRPETELLVERALAHLPADTTAALADLGTGSGAVALALARERPRAHVYATDASAATLAVADENLRRCGAANVELRRGEWLAALAGIGLDLIASNPPYVRSDDPALARGELAFEPRAALDGGPDGLAAIRAIVAQARPHLRPGGWLLLEHGHDQGAAVRAVLAASGYREVATHRDLAGHERVTEGRAPAAAD